MVGGWWVVDSDDGGDGEVVEVLKMDTSSILSLDQCHLDTAISRISTQMENILGQTEET